MTLFLKQLTGSAALGILCLACSGCATWKDHGVTPDHGKLRIAVLPVLMNVRVTQLRAIHSVQDEDHAATNEAALVAQELNRVRDHVTEAIQNGLTNSAVFVPVTRADAQALLQARISGYGKIKREWVWWLIGSGVAEGIFQGFVAAKVVDNVWIGVAVAAEEIISESLTWGGGTYLFDKVFTPVILETELLSAADGHRIWSDTSLARSNRKALKTFPKADQEKKEIRLRVTSDLVVQDMVTALEKEAARNISPVLLRHYRANGR